MKIMFMTSGSQRVRGMRRAYFVQYCKNGIRENRAAAGSPAGAGAPLPCQAAVALQWRVHWHWQSSLTTLSTTVPSDGFCTGLNCTVAQYCTVLTTAVAAVADIARMRRRGPAH
jgi:hypothetical protein